jgi:hypothetical protein
VECVERPAKEVRLHAEIAGEAKSNLSSAVYSFKLLLLADVEIFEFADVLVASNLDAKLESSVEGVNFRAEIDLFEELGGSDRHHMGQAGVLRPGAEGVTGA